MLVSASFAVTLVVASQWSEGPEAPAPDPAAQPLPYPQAPREPGAREEQLAVPPLPPEPVLPPLDDGIPDELARDFMGDRFVTSRTRDELFARGALDVDTALVDVPGLWLRHVQAGSSRLLARGLDERDVVVVMDGVPLFDLGGLVPPLEQLSNASTARLTLHHGARAVSPGASAAAGMIDVDTLGALREQGESAGLHGRLAGGYGGADLEKGVLTQLETGFRRARFAAHATLLNREDLRLGRSNSAVATALAQPGGLLEQSSGSGGAVGARLDVVPHDGLHVFTTWHSARVLEVPRPGDTAAHAANADAGTCSELDDIGRSLDCTRTVERGLDAWIVGADQRVDVAGAMLVVRGRAHAQHAKALDERSGSGILVVQRSLDEGVRAGARGTAELALPPVALLDVWTPRAIVGLDAYADRFQSQLFSRSTRGRDAEPPGDGVLVPGGERLENGGVDGMSALSLTLVADGARATLWSGGRVALLDEGRASTVAPEGELGARVRVVEGASLFAAAVHQHGDDTLELGASLAQPWASADVVVWGAARARLDVRAPASDDGIVEVSVRETTAWGAEARGHLRTGVDGLTALGTFGVVSVDDGAPLATRVAASGVVNPHGTLTLDYDAPVGSGGDVRPGFFARARALFPQQRLSPSEELDRGLCPELPTDEELASGAVRTEPCSGVDGAFLLDVGAHLDMGGVRFDVVAENVLDQQGALRGEPLGFGGTAVRALLTLRL